MVTSQPNLSISLSSGASLHAFYPSVLNTRLAIIVIPGGSYRPGPYAWCKVAEGSDVAQQLAEQFGIMGLVLHYRLPAGRPTVPLADALMAISTVRTSRLHWPLSSPSLVGIMGFSAGGHLAALATTRYMTSSSRPSFAMLMYPVISMDFENYTHVNSRREYLGNAPTAAQVAEYSADRHVNTRTPPTFLVHARDDHVVPLGSSKLYYNACAAQQARCTLVEVSQGGHPFANKPHVWQPARTAALAWLCATFAHGRSISLPEMCAGLEGTSSLRARLLQLPGVAAVWQTLRQQ